MADTIRNTRDVVYSLQDINLRENSPIARKIKRSLSIIQQELINIRNYNNNRLTRETVNEQPDEEIINEHPAITIHKRKVKSSLEFYFMNKLYNEKDTYIFTGFPEILQPVSDDLIVTMPLYKKLVKSQWCERDIIVGILNTLKKLAELGFSHRAINISHILFDKDKKIPVIVDYGKMSIIGKKSQFYTRHPLYSSRNALLQNPARILDDLESYGYVLVSKCLNITLSTYQKKEDFVRNYRNISNPFFRKYFQLISQQNEDHDSYLEIIQ